MTKSICKNRAIPIIALLITLCLTTACAQAGAIPPGAEMVDFYDGEGVLDIWSMLALEDGGFVIGGQVQHPGEFLLPYRYDYPGERYLVRNDAIAMRVNRDGQVLWTIRFGDPVAINVIRSLGLLPDGRILMRYLAEDSTFGDRTFIVGLDGVVEEMLPWRKLAEHYRPRSMMLMPESGYLGGDSSIVDFYYDYHMGLLENVGYSIDRKMTLLDFDLNVVWCIDLSPLGPGVGNYDAMEVSDGIILFGSEQKIVQSAYADVQLGFTSILKLDKRTGETLWHIADEPRAGGSHSVHAMLETPDGALLFTGGFLEDGAAIGEGEQLITLTKVTADGEHLWTKRYEDPDIRCLRNMAPFENGYLLVCNRWSARNRYDIWYIDASGELLGTLTIDEEEKRMTVDPGLMAAPDGTVYICGTVRTAVDEDSDAGGELIGSYLGVVNPGYFTELE